VNDGQDKPATPRFSRPGVGMLRTLEFRLEEALDELHGLTERCNAEGRRVVARWRANS
jgi:hypothetical protein